MATIFEAYIARRKEVKEMLDAIHEVAVDIIIGLCSTYPLIDPLNNLPIMRMERESTPDGSRSLALQTSNQRSLTFHFQSNGEVRVVNALGNETLSDDYLDLALTDGGGVLIAGGQGDGSLDAHIYAWTHGAFEE
jgi:hypothetical protein